MNTNEHSSSGLTCEHGIPHYLKCEKCKQPLPADLAKAIREAESIGFWGQLSAKSSEQLLSSAKQLQQIQQATGLCEKHQPNGGARRCVICSCESMHLALNKISYICGEPNEFEMSQFDDHGNEMEVVKQIEGLKSKLQQVEKERDEWKAKAEELEGRIANALL